VRQVTQGKNWNHRRQHKDFPDVHVAKYAPLKIENRLEVGTMTNGWRPKGEQCAIETRAVGWAPYSRFGQRLPPLRKMRG
jgi:hypothetical protein